MQLIPAIDECQKALYAQSGQISISIAESRYLCNRRSWNKVEGKTKAPKFFNFGAFGLSVCYVKSLISTCIKI